MTQLRPNIIRIYLVMSFLALLPACAATPYSPDDSAQAAVEQRALKQTHGDFTVRASVPGEIESKALFDLPLHRRQIQAVWLEITNNSPLRARFAPYSVDPDYFPPHEIAYMHRSRFSRQGHRDMEQYLDNLSLPRQIPPGETVSGYVFTHSTVGTKAFNVDIHYTGGAARHEHFTFFVDVPGFVPDHASVKFDELYAPDELQQLGHQEFRALLETWPCCTRNHDGTADGWPVSSFLVASGQDLLQALLRAGWSESSYTKDDNYLISSNYYFKRPPDAIFKIGRNRNTDRMEMSLWLTPAHIDGIPVWAVQIRHAVGRLFDIGAYFLGVRLDPDADEGRNFLLQNLWYSQSLVAFGWSRSGQAVSRDDPRDDFSGNIWFSDGYRLVSWVSGEPISLRQAESLEWDRILDVNEERGR